MKSGLLLLLILPALLSAQPFQREVSPFPVENYGRLLPAPFTGGFKNMEPYFVDIDADGAYDLFAGDWEGNIWYFRNDGSLESPHFVFITDHVDSINVEPKIYYQTKICFCDIDADGDQDLFLSGQKLSSIFDGSIFFYQNIGTPQYPQFTLEDTLFGGISYEGYITMDFCDIDNDNDYDLFISGWNDQNFGRLCYYRNIGTAQSYDYQLVTQAFDSISIGAVFYPRFVDIDNDSDFDLFIGGGGAGVDSVNGRIFYYENIGTPENYDFNLISTFYDSIFVQDEASPFFTDIDDDGDYDLFIGKGDETPYFDTGNMGGDLVFYQNNGVSTEPDFEFATKNYLGIDVGMGNCPRFCDIDDDGDSDLFIAHTCNYIVFYRNEGDANNPYFVLEDEQYQGIQADYSISIDFADIDADEDYDLFISSGVFGECTIALYINQGTPAEADFQVETYNLVGMIESVHSICLVDINADNDYDLFVSNQEGGSDAAIMYFNNLGDSANYNFVLNNANYFNINSLYYSQGMDFADIDNDGDYDIFTTSWYPLTSTYFSIMKYTNTGTNRNANYILTDSSFADVFFFNYNVSPEFCDIDADGDLDLFIGELYGGTEFYRNLQYNSVSHNTTPQPYSFSLEPCYPNPFNPTTSISFTLNRALPITLSVYNQLGQQVTTIINNQFSPGNYQFNWNADNCSSGMYYISLETQNQKQTQKVILLK